MSYKNIKTFKFFNIVAFINPTSNGIIETKAHKDRMLWRSAAKYGSSLGRNLHTSFANHLLSTCSTVILCLLVLFHPLICDGLITEHAKLHADRLTLMLYPYKRLLIPKRIWFLEVLLYFLIFLSWKNVCSSRIMGSKSPDELSPLTRQSSPDIVQKSPLVMLSLLGLWKDYLDISFDNLLRFVI